MQAQATAGTAPERLLRAELRRVGVDTRRRANRPLPLPRRSADLVFARARVAVFVDGCFWHACPDHYRPPNANGRWWVEKLARNIARDRDTDERLAALGWRVVRVWEHDDMGIAARNIARAVRSAPHGGQRPPDAGDPRAP